MKLADFELRDGIYVREAPVSEYRAQWEAEAATDHVRSAIAVRAETEDYSALTGKVARCWREFPHGKHFDAVVEIGCGYGRVPLYLSRERDVRCGRYVGVDISETMLRHALRYREQYDVFPGAEFELVSASAEQLPLEDESVDLAISSAVFLHMGKRYVEAALREVARVLRPGGAFVFDDSFPNALCPANLPFLVRGAIPLRRRPHTLKYYTRGEVRSLLGRTGVAAKAAKYRIEADDYAIVPKRLGPLEVPGARAVNARAARAPRALEPLLATAFTVSTL